MDEPKKKRTPSGIQLYVKDDAFNEDKARDEMES
jgi:hypothetical protein